VISIDSEERTVRYQASHSVTCDVSPAQVYALISDSRRWPELLEPCEAVTVLSSDASSEHIELSAQVNGERMTWQSKRRFRPEVFGVETTVVQPMKLVAAMTTSWRVVALNALQSVLVLEHDYDLCDDVTGQVEGVSTRSEAAVFIETAIDRNSTVELGNIKAAVERAALSPAAVEPSRNQHLRHSIVCDAPADLVYGLVRSTDSWPTLFDACVGVRVLEATPDSELVRVEALQDGRTVSWDTRRTYHDTIRRVDYQLLVPMPLVESMSGQWRVLQLDSRRCLLTVDRTWRMLPDVTRIRPGIHTVTEASAFVRAFVDGNAGAEMIAIRALAESGTEALTSTTSRYFLPHPADRVYGVLADVAGWRKILPHCESLDVRYDDGTHQEFTMDVQAGDDVETFRSVRFCDAQTLTITYFQPEPPPAMTRHTGSWEVRAVEGGSEVVSRHTAVLGPAAARAFGTNDVRRLKGRVREQLERNSGLTVDACDTWLRTNPDGGTSGTSADA